MATLVLLVSLQCSVYDASLLGSRAQAGGGATDGRGGASATGGTDAASGRGGDSELGSGAGGAGFGGLIGMAGSIDSGGGETNGGSAGNEEGGGVIGGSGGAVGGSGGTVGGAGGASARRAGGGAIPTANGCAKLSVPLDAGSDKAHFVISLSSPADLRNAKLSMRIYVQAGQGGTIFSYVQDSGTYRFLGNPVRRPLSPPRVWTPVDWDVGAEPDPAVPGVDKMTIRNIGVEINAQPSSIWSNPTIVYIDSISVTNPALNFNFDASASVNPTPSTTSASGQAFWLNIGATDTTAAGATLSWQSTCP